MKKRVKVIMLPTEDSTSVIKQGTSSTLCYYSNPASAATKHLYFVSDEELKDGEWCYKNSMKKGNMIFEYDSSNIWHKGAYKIVATTDESLVYLINIGRVRYNLPQISQEFIENYCEVGGIDEVDIEYENVGSNADTLGVPIDYEELEDIFKIKVDSNYCVIIHPIKDSWSKEEVEKLIESAVHDFAGMNTYDDDNLTEWINENL